MTTAGLGDLRRDATCTIEPQSLVGEYFVDCQPGSSRSACPTEDDPAGPDEGHDPADLVNDILRRPARERLRLLVASLGTGLAGRPERSEPCCAVPTRVCARRARRSILGAQNRDIRGFLRTPTPW